jgi:hypothetical protein
MQKREITERVSKEFLIGLLSPFHPTLKTNEQIVGLNIKQADNAFDFKYEVNAEEGGVKNSTQLCEGEQVGGHESPSSPKRSPEPGKKKSPKKRPGSQGRQ